MERSQSQRRPGLAHIDVPAEQVSGACRSRRHRSRTKVFLGSPSSFEDTAWARPRLVSSARLRIGELSLHEHKGGAVCQPHA